MALCVITGQELVRKKLFCSESNQETTRWKNNQAKYLPRFISFSPWKKIVPNQQEVHEELVAGIIFVLDSRISLQSYSGWLTN